MLSTVGQCGQAGRESGAPGRQVARKMRRGDLEPRRPGRNMAEWGRPTNSWTEGGGLLLGSQGRHCLQETQWAAERAGVAPFCGRSERISVVMMAVEGSLSRKGGGTGGCGGQGKAGVHCQVGSGEQGHSFRQFASGVVKGGLRGRGQDRLLAMRKSSSLDNKAGAGDGE